MTESPDLKIAAALITATMIDRQMYVVGANGVAEITVVRRPLGEGTVDYVCVWTGDDRQTLVAEFAQHNIVGIYMEGADAIEAMRQEVIDDQDEGKA